MGVGAADSVPAMGARVGRGLLVGEGVGASGVSMTRIDSGGTGTTAVDAVDEEVVVAGAPGVEAPAIRVGAAAGSVFAGVVDSFRVAKTTMIATARRAAVPSATAVLFDPFGGGATVGEVAEGGAVSEGIGFGPEATEIVGASESLSGLGGSTGWGRSAGGRAPGGPEGGTAPAGGPPPPAAPP